VKSPNSKGLGTEETKTQLEMEGNLKGARTGAERCKGVRPSYAVCV